MTEASNDEFFQHFFNVTLVDQCISSEEEISDLNQTECVAEGICRFNSSGFEYEKMSQEECKQLQQSSPSPNFEGVCEICEYADDGDCYKLPFGNQKCFVFLIILIFCIWYNR